MTTALLFIFLFTIPFVLLPPEGEAVPWDDVVYNCLAVFVITYGFMGMLLIAIQLDDPFGDDPNDFK